nr:hypothetical protein CFP56_04401 [Quercus suber]
MHAVGPWTRALALASFYPLFGLAFEQAPYVASGSAPSDGFATFIAFADTPNVTHSVQFRHIEDSSLDPVIAQNWTWSVSVSDVPMANASMLNDSMVREIPDAHVAYTTHKLSWPESGNLNQALREEADANEPVYPLCAIVFSALFPQGIDDGWDASSPDCTSALGSDCVNYLTTMSATSDDCRVESSSLTTTGFDQACPASFGALKLSWSFGGFALGNTTTNTTSLEKNGTFAYSVSQPYAAGNDTAYDPIANELQILILTGQQNKVLCNRAGDGSTHENAARTLGAGIGVTVVFLVALITVAVNGL